VSCSLSKPLALICAIEQFFVIGTSGVLAAGQEEGAGREESIVLVDEEETSAGAGKAPAATEDGAGLELACPMCDSANFYFIIDEVNGVDIQQENSFEDVSESRLRIDSGFTWKKAGGRFGAKAEVRLDFLVSGKKDEQGEYGLSRSEVKLEPREWFAEFVTKPVDIRVGSQLLRFSKCDIFAPGDLLAPYDLREPYRGELSIPRLPVIAVRTDWKLPGDLLVTLALVPFFTGPRFDLFGTDQAVIGPNAPQDIRPFISDIEKIVDPSVSDRVRDAMLASNVPEEWGPNQSVGLRIEKTWQSLEAGLTYLFTFGPVPELVVNPDFFTALVLFHGGIPQAAGQMISDIIAGGESFVRTDYRRIHVFSMDASTEAGPVVLTAEAGWIPEMVLGGADIARAPEPVYNVRTGLITASFQAQYNYGELFYLVGEVAYARMLGPALIGGGGAGGRDIPPVIFFGDHTSQLVVGLASRLTLLKGRLEWSVTGQAGVLDRSMILSTRLSYELIGRLRPYIGVVFYEVFGDRPQPDLSLAASRDYNDEIFIGIQFY
jgi:hypothetical protein